MSRQFLRLLSGLPRKYAVPVVIGITLVLLKFALE
jgi:hypothetical protein